MIWLTSWGDRPSLVQSEMSGVEQVHLGGGHVFAEGHRAGHRERQVVLAPHHQGRRLPLAEIRLPLRVGRDVGPIVVEQVELDVYYAGPGEKRVLALPGVWVDPLGMRTATDVP